MKKLYFSFTLLLMLICGLQSIQATTVYYNNPNNWSKVNCYIYNDNGKNADWPGAAMTYDATITHDGVTGWWKYDVPADFASGSLIVNDGNGNQYPAAFQPGVQLSGKKSAWLKGTTLTESDEAYSGNTGGNTGGTVTGDGIHVYAKASTAPYIYVWYDDNGTNKEPNGDWNNTKAMTATSASGWYVYTAPSGVSSINFILQQSAGGNKFTGNVMNVTSDVYYAVNGSSASVTTERPDIVSEDVYVYFLNKSNWEKVYCYLYIDKKAHTTWPGLEMTLDNSIEHDGTTGWYTLKVPEGYTNASFVINNGKDGAALNGETVYDESTTTSISRINTSVKDPNAWYTITGMKVSAPTKAGLYIHNGKKVIVVK